MKSLFYTIITLITLVSVMIFQQKRIELLKNENKAYKQNEQTLLGDINRYKTKDSLNAISVSNLQLSLESYKKYRANEYKIIKQLEIDRKRLQSITNIQTQTIHKMKSNVKDSIVYLGNEIVDSLKCIDISKTWYDMHGCINKDNEFIGNLNIRDSLLYIEHIIPKRFLFFKFGVKDRKQEIISKNPNTIITDAEFISIRE